MPAERRPQIVEHPLRGVRVRCGLAGLQAFCACAVPGFDQNGDVGPLGPPDRIAGRRGLRLYDPIRRTYVASDDHLGLEDPGDLPPMLEVIADGAGDRFDALPMPHRGCPAVVVRHLYQAMERNLRIEIDYVSMSSGRTRSQWIAPTRIGFDGARLHFRAWSYRRSEWRDYLPVRVSDASTFRTEPIPEAPPADAEWDRIVRVGLRPRTDLSPEQRQAVRSEYGLDRGDLIVETREALAFYLDRRWGLDLPDARLERASDR